MERLTIYKTDKARYSVRPIDWEGIWDKQGRIKENGLNHTGIFAEKEDAEFFAKSKNAEEQGRLLILPCKPGDTVYSFCEEFGRVLPYVVDQIIIDCYSHTVSDRYISISANCTENNELIDCIDFYFEDIGGSVFMTDQEAKEALEGVKNVN